MSQKPDPLDNFLSRKAEIDEALQRLQTLSDDHFEANPDNIHWGHVGTVAQIAEKLKEITDFAFNEGEFAE
jgi:hypothetical protein